MSTLRVNTIQDASGGDIVNSRGIAKAWVNFNGTGTVAIRSAMNVSSITDNGTGDYTVNYSTAFSDANYSATLGQARTSVSADWGFMGTYNYSTTSIRVTSRDTAGSAFDYGVVNVAIFR